jgi:uncharacterized membrane protein SpoIIM required for sporulation
VAGFVLKSAQFRREREHAWRELEGLLAEIERGGTRRLTAAELNRLPSLYRSAVSSLSVAQAISLDRNLLDYLTALTGRAYLAVYGPKRGAGATLAGFFRRDFPRAVRANALFLAAALALLAAGVLTGYRLTRADPEAYYSFIPAEMAQGRTPAASTAELRRVLYRSHPGAPLELFAAFLFTHNAKIGILCFALGVAAGAPVPFLLFWNGLSLGALAALYASRGLGAELWAWVLPHGVTELTAVALCAAGGLVIARCLLFPGLHTRLENLAQRGRQAALLGAGAVAMFLVAGGIEGIFRQLVRQPSVRWSVALATATFWSWYFLFVGRGEGGWGAGGRA